MSEKLSRMIQNTELHGPDTGGGRSGGSESSKPNEQPKSEKPPVVIVRAQPDDSGFDDVFIYATKKVEDDLRKANRHADADQVRNLALTQNFTQNGITWYRDLRFKLETNEEEILVAFSQLSNVRIDEEGTVPLSEAEKAVLFAAGQFQIRRYAADVLHHLTVDATASGHSLENRIKELDRLLGPSFQNSDVRSHYENAKLGLGLWRFGEVAAAAPGTAPHLSEIPHIELQKGTTTTWADVLYMDDIHGWYKKGFKDPNWEKKNQRLVDVMSRLDKSDDDILTVDRRNGAELVQRADGQWVRKPEDYRDGQDLGQLSVVDSKFAGTAWLVADKRIAVELEADDGRKYYVYRDKLQGGVRRIGQAVDYSDYYVDERDLVDVYNRGRTFEEKIREGRDDKELSELEVLAIRVADGLGEHIQLSVTEQKRIFEKERALERPLPKTPKEDKLTDWGIRHKGLWTAWMPHSRYSVSDVYRDLPDAAFETHQPQKTDNYRLKKDDGSEVIITLNADKRDSYRRLVGTGYSTLASMSKTEFIRFARDKKAQYPALVYERANSQMNLIEDIEARVRDHGRLTIEDVAAMSSSDKASIRKFSPLIAEQEEIILKLTRDTTTTETRGLQLIDNPAAAAKRTIEKVRSGFAREELIAYKLSPARVPEGRTLFNITNEERARILLNEVWTIDEAIIKDSVVGYDEWNKAVMRKYAASNADKKAFKPFLGGVAFEQWLYSNKLFKKGGVLDSRGKQRAVTAEEFYRWAGIEIYWDKYTVTRKKKSKSGKVTEEPVTMWRKRLRLIGQTEKPPIGHPQYAAQMQEYNKWQAYKADPTHGVDRNVAAALGRWMNAGWPPKIPTDYDNLDVLAPLPEETDILRDKYKVLDYTLEWFYPNREWRSNAVVQFVRRANRRKSPDVLGKPDTEERLRDRNIRGSSRYRWGWLPGRQPLKMWQAYTEMNNGTRFELAPETKQLAKIIIDSDGKEIARDAKKPGHIELYRVGSPSYIDPVLKRRGIEKPGYVTYQTLINMPRRFSRSIESIEYGGGRFIPPKGASLGVHRRPMELQKHAMQVKLPWLLVEKSFDYQLGVLYQDVVSGMGSGYKKGDEKSEDLAWELTKKRFDEENWSSKIATIVDTYFTYATLKDTKKINEQDYMALLCLSGSWFEFRRDGVTTRPEGLQGGNFIELLENLGIEDPQLKEFMQRRDEQAKRMIKDLTKVSTYFLDRRMAGIELLIDKFGELRTSSLRTFWTHAKVPLVLTGGSLAASAGLNVLATNHIIPMLHVAAQYLPILGLLGSVARGVWVARTASPRDEPLGKMKNGKYKPAALRNARVSYASIEAHMGGYAAYDYPDKDIIEGAAKISDDLSATYTNAWLARYASQAAS